MTDLLSYIYIVSTSRSGSTLLSILLNSHPQIASIGELDNSMVEYTQGKNNNEYLCSCGTEIKKCEFWRKVRDRCLAADVDLDLHNFNVKLDAGWGDLVNSVLFGSLEEFPFLRPIRDTIFWQLPIYKHFIQDKMNRNSIISRSVLEVTGKEIFVDASKSPSRAAYIAKTNNIDFKLIHLVRDVGGVLNSYRKNNRWRGNDGLSFVVNNWRKTHQATLRLKSKLQNDSYLLINYERLCNDLSEALSEILRFLNVEPVDLAESVNNKVHHIIGNRMRLKKFNGIQIDEEWKKNLTPSEIDKCNQIVGDLGKALGYE